MAVVVAGGEKIGLAVAGEVLASKCIGGALPEQLKGNPTILRLNGGVRM